jgi:sodium-dependent dicarboxylate transporter 2/3/5
MAAWWMTEAIPIPATALLPLVLFPVLGILDMPAAAGPYAQEIIFLFMGGFFIAMAMEKWGLHRRIALAIVAAVGTGPRTIILGFMAGTAFLSMWISNTATATMMLPIAVAVGEMFRPSDQDGRFEFGIALMLGIAYAASIGGVATLIGTPPNAVMAGAASEILGVEVGFVQWMGVGLPVTLIFLPVAWFVLTFLMYPPGAISGDAGSILEAERKGLGPMSRGERIVAVVFVLAAAAWVFRSPKTFGAVTIPGIQSIAPWVRDSTIAMAAALILFLAPVDRKKGTQALDWPTARRIPWGVLLLFGGGLSLARAMAESGLAEWVGGAVGGLADLPTWIILAGVAGLFVFLTEVTSNAATTTMAMPIMAGAAMGLDMPPLTLMATAALAASMAFMLPVATPPNAIVFGSGYVTIPEMTRAGFLLNLLAIVLITGIATFLVPYFLLS